MALSSVDVARLASLARIDLTDEELERMAPQLDIILESISHVAKVAGDDVEATSHPVAMTNVMREDQTAPSWPASQMLAGAPQVEDQQFRVPRIIAAES